MSILLTATYGGVEGALTFRAETLDAAAETVRRLSAAADAKNRLYATLTAEAGSYSLSAPVAFDAEKTPGLAYTDLTLTAKDGRAAFTGCVPLDASRFEMCGDYYTVQLPADKEGNYPHFRDFYVDGKRLPICQSGVYRYPFTMEGEKARRGKDPRNHRGIYIPEEIATMLPEEDLYPMEITMWVEWEFFTVQVTGIDRSDVRVGEDGERYVLAKTVYDQQVGFANGVNLCNLIKNRETYLANHEEFLTPGTWCYNYKTGILCYMPEEGALIEETKFEIPILENLIEFRGMEGITCQNLDFTGTTSKFIVANGYLSGQANNESRAGRLPHSAILTKGVRRFTMENCSFTELGANGLIMLDSSIIVRITGCRFDHIGMAALSIGNPTTAWEDPKNRNVDVVIENNLFYHIGYEYPTAVGFYISMVDGLSFCHNTMRETAYSAVSIGWGWSPVSFALGEKVNVRNAEVAYNKIVDYMQILRDGAAIYVLGANCRRETVHQFNTMHDNYAERELFDASKRGYYMDGSASNWHVYHSVTSGTPLPIFSQFHVPSQYTWHNRIDDIYTTDPVSDGNHHPERDTLLGAWYLEPTLEELFATYPEAKSIMEKAGCDEELEDQLF